MYTELQHRSKIFLACVALGCALAGCAPRAHRVPENWLPTADQAGADAFGAWVRVEAWEDARGAVEGELIAVGSDSIYVIAAVGLDAIPADKIGRVVLITHDSNTESMVGWATLGTISTLSHGVFLVVSAPLWIVAGTIAAYEANKAGKQEHTPNDAWPEVAQALRPFARFPAGLPQEIDRGALQRKGPGARILSAPKRSSSPWAKDRP